ncbi:unnamed protein product [Rhizophagus irregularis]|nr:unnamed protein product [Rhizophagus irregularis]
MELANTNDENFFDPTPRLKSSPIPIKFISFNKYDDVCIYCGEIYITTLSCYTQKYCKKCLSSYINDITDDNTYLDVYYTMNSECSEHEISMTKVPQCIQECCENCLKILYFKQISGHNNNPAICNKVIESEKCCKLCGKSLYQGTVKNGVEYYKLCSDCYIISFSGCIESTFAKKQIMIFYLPWWHDNAYCDICISKLKFVSDCQKYCTDCFIYYVGCRYCLTTNMIFGLTSQSQYVKEMTKGGYGIIYKANWLKSYQHFFNDPINSKVIKIYGFTKDGLEDYILVLEYASGGDLHKYLQKNFTTITWNNKLNILSEISTGLEYIHKDEFIHRDFHSGNILLSGSNIFQGMFDDWKIGDLGLSQSVDNKSMNNEVYGVIPYICTRNL